MLMAARRALQLSSCGKTRLDEFFRGGKRSGEEDVWRLRFAWVLVEKRGDVRGEHDICAARKRARFCRKRVPRLAPHHHHPVKRERFEPTQIQRQPPRKRAVHAYAHLGRRRRHHKLHVGLSLRLRARHRADSARKWRHAARALQRFCSPQPSTRLDQAKYKKFDNLACVHFPKLVYLAVLQKREADFIRRAAQVQLNVYALTPARGST
mmetsp:Transcript_14914/g.39975  ORF Transcript_14914/g.39975 Transcript_14914/m.39975 type:complete len:209 (+) Transcript_14914:1239-1865(+)